MLPRSPLIGIWLDGHLLHRLQSQWSSVLEIRFKTIFYDTFHQIWEIKLIATRIKMCAMVWVQYKTIYFQNFWCIILGRTMSLRSIVIVFGTEQAGYCYFKECWVFLCPMPMKFVERLWNEEKKGCFVEFVFQLCNLDLKIIWATKYSQVLPITETFWLSNSM